MDLLKLVQVSKEYQKDQPVLRDVSLSLQGGELVALAGPSGSGKSTILNLAAGLDRPSTGAIEVMGKTISRMRPERLLAFRRDHFGFVFQNYNLFPVLTALENVEYPLAIRKVPKAERQARARKVLEEVGLKGFEKRFPSELSGGQQQRVAVARALVGQPQIIFADEPTANLDSKTTERMMQLFGELNRLHRITFLISSHDPQVLASIPRIISVRDGQILRDTGKLFLHSVRGGNGGMVAYDI